MNRAVNDRRFLPDVFHDVNFAATWPSHRAAIIAQHPECRPHSLPVWNLDARFKATILLFKLAGGLHPRRSIVARDTVGPGICFLECGDNQRTILNLRVLRATRVVLWFVIAPTIAAYIGGAVISAAHAVC